MTTISKENTTPEVNEAVSSEPMFTKKDLRKMCWRSLPGGFSVNWDRYVHKTFTFMIAPMLKRIYKNDHEGYVKALQRNMEFFNITPQVHAFMGGLTVAMEEQNAKDPNFDPKTINSVKAALMGTLSGIFDSIFPGTLRIIAAGIGISLAAQGNILGPILYALIYCIPSYICRFKGGQIGYRLGTGFLDKLQASGLMDKLMLAASILGLLVIGGMTYTMVNTNFVLTFGAGTESAMTLQTALDSIMPGIAKLGFVGLFYWLLGKKVNTFVLIIGTILGCIALTALGIMG